MTKDNALRLLVIITVITIPTVAVATGLVKINKPYDMVGENQKYNTFLEINAQNCYGVIFKNSTGDKICITWNDLHDGILYLNHMKKELDVKINSTTYNDGVTYMNQTGVDMSPDIVSENYVSFDDGCKTAFDYNNVTLEYTREYLVSGNCTNADMPMLDKYVKQFLNEKSNERLTQETNVRPATPDDFNKISTPTLTEATNCQDPCDTSALTEGTKMGLLWTKIQDQNKQILENQNIMMCLEVVKNPDTWIQIGKYLTERGVNCTGLEIK